MRKPPVLDPHPTPLRLTCPVVTTPSPRPWRLVVTREREAPHYLAAFVVYDAAGALIEHYHVRGHEPAKRELLVLNRRLLVAAVNCYAGEPAAEGRAVVEDEEAGEQLEMAL